MKSSRWWVLAITLVVVIAAIWFWKSQAKGSAPKYRTATIDRGPIDFTVSATGTIQPVEHVEVGSQVSGTVSKLLVDYNSKVKAGQVLLQLDPASFRAREMQADAAVAKAQAALAKAQQDEKRAQELFKLNYIAEADLQTATATRKQAEADVKNAQAALESARVDLVHTTITAPIDGVVISRDVDLGQTVAASLQAPNLFEIAKDLTRMQVETNISEADIGGIHDGLPVTFTVDAYPDLTFRGQVTQVRLVPITQSNVTTYTTVIGTANPGEKLRPGMTANVTVLVAHHDDVLKVPAAALRFRPPSSGKGGNGRGGAGGGGGTRAAAADGAPAAGGSGGGGMGAGGMGGAGGRRDTSAAGGGGRRGGGGPGGWGGRGGHRDSSAWVGRGGAGGRTGGMRGGAAGGGADTAQGVQRTATPPGTIYVLRNGKPVRVFVHTGLSDGANVEVASDQLQEGDQVIIGLEATAMGGNLQPPPGMGGFGGRPGGGGGGRGR